MATALAPYGRGPIQPQRTNTKGHDSLPASGRDSEPVLPVQAAENSVTATMSPDAGDSRAAKVATTSPLPGPTNSASKVVVLPIAVPVRRGVGRPPLQRPWDPTAAKYRSAATLRRASANAAKSAEAAPAAAASAKKGTPRLAHEHAQAPIGPLWRNVEADAGAHGISAMRAVRARHVTAGKAGPLRLPTLVTLLDGDGDGSGELQDADGDEHQLTIAPGTDDRARSSKRANGRQSRCTAVASDAQVAV